MAIPAYSGQMQSDNNDNIQINVFIIYDNL